MPTGGYPLHVPRAPLDPINLSLTICGVVHSTQLIAGIAPTACFHEVEAVKADIQDRTMCTCAARAPRTLLSLSTYHQVALFEFYTHAKVGCHLLKYVRKYNARPQNGAEMVFFLLLRGTPCAPHGYRPN